MLPRHFYQEETDDSLRLAHLLVRLARAPRSVSKKEWEFLNTLPISSIERAAHISHKEALHVANQIDRVEADASRMGHFEHLTDAFMMWLVGASFIFAGVLLAVLAIPESMLGRLMIPISLGIGLFFILIPFINRKRVINSEETFFNKVVIQILGTGLLKRSALTTDALIREIDRNDPKKILFKVIEKFIAVQGSHFSKKEEICLLEQLLDGFSLKLSDLPYPIIQEVEQN